MSQERHPGGAAPHPAPEGDETLPAPRWERALRIVALVGFALLAILVLAPPRVLTDDQWNNVALVTTLFDLTGALWLLLASLVALLLIRALLRPRTHRRLLGLWLIAAGMAGLFALCDWWVIATVASGPYAARVYLPTSAAPLILLPLALFGLGGLLLIVQLARASRLNAGGIPDSGGDRPLRGGAERT
jgi:hypothetical protein